MERINISLHQLSKADLEARQKNALKGGVASQCNSCSGCSDDENINNKMYNGVELGHIDPS